MSKKQRPELLIIGLGIMLPGQITVQASQALARCVRIYSIVQEDPRIWLPYGCYGKIEVVNALSSYIEGRVRTQNYDSAATSIIDALKEGGVIGYVTYGNPMAYDRVAQNLLVLAKTSGITVRIVPGVSSFDTVLCDLRIDMAPAIQVFEASWLVACEIHPRIDIPLLLMQVSAFGSLRTHYTRRQDGSSLVELANHLGISYPPEHTIYLVVSTGNESRTSAVHRVSLCDLCEVSTEELSGASLYVPPLTNVSPNMEIVKRMEEA